MDLGWDKVATWGISTPFSANVPKYMAMLATRSPDPQVLKTVANRSYYLCDMRINAQPLLCLITQYCVVYLGLTVLTYNVFAFINYKT